MLLAGHGCGATAEAFAPEAELPRGQWRVLLLEQLQSLQGLM